MRIRKDNQFTEDQLKSMNVVDTTPRTIRAFEIVKFKCQYCDNIGEKKFSDAKRSIKLSGHYYQCRDCYVNIKLKERSNNVEWHENMKIGIKNSEKRKEGLKITAKKKIAGK